MTEARGDSRAAVEFLQALRPDGPWALTSIVPDGKTTTATFDGKSVADMVLWLDQRQGIENLYYTVNPVLRAIKSKAKKTDISAMEFLHVDIDPRAGEDHAKERERILARLQAAVPRPTFCIDSGGGYQALWRLDESLPVDGNEEKAEDVEAYNIQLEVLFGADACHNVDRILRLPGTVNVPNKKKRAKGRVAAPTLLAWHEPLSYPIAQFTKAPRVQQGQGSGLASGGQARVKLTAGNVERLGDVEELGDKVNAYTKMLILQGDDPDDPTRFPSRSEVVMRVCCDLIRAGVADEVIYAVITDPQFGVATSVLEKARPEKYALRQIERAREEVIHPMLRELNERHAVIADIGGRCRIISEVMDHALGRPRLSRQSFDDFRNRYMHVKVEVGRDQQGRAVEKPAGSWWVQHPLRRQYETIVFAPSVEVPAAYNLWRGFACDAIPGDCQLYLDHLRENICRGKEELYHYLVRWLARAVQMPNCAGEVAVVLRGNRGTGKGFFVREFGRLWGRHFLQVSNSKHLVGNFNAHLRDAVLLFGDEAFYAGDKSHESVLKMLVTEELIPIEAKGVDVELSPNFTHIILASNADWVVPAGADERRFFVLEVGEDRKQDSTYFAKVRKQLDSGGRQALLHYLLNLDLTGFDVRKVPQTQALREQKLLSMGPEEQWWYDKLHFGRAVDRHDRWEREVPTRQLQRDYVEALTRMGVQRRVSATALGRFLARVCPPGYPKTSQRLAEVSEEGLNGFEHRRKERAYFYTLPELAQCRALWDQRYGGPYDWPPEPSPPAERENPV